MDRPARSILVALFLLGSLAVLPQIPASAANFSPATVANLITDINTANANSQDDVIDLGGLTFTLTAADNNTFGNNGLPVILADTTHILTIQNGVITRGSSAPSFRLIQVASGAELHLDHVELSGGDAGTGVGGGVGNFGTLNVASSTIENNTAGGDGGGIFSSHALSVNASTIAYNESTSGDGGGIYYGATASVTDSTIANNTAAIGGGGIGSIIAVGTVAVTSSTIADNTTAGTAGGIMGGGSSLRSSIVAGNTATSASDCTGTFTTESFNLIGNNAGCTIVGGTPNANNSYVGTSSTPINPMLQPLGNYGGPTKTIALDSSSVAVNHGSNPLALSFDQRGAPRSAGGQPDIGAYELYIPGVWISNVKKREGDSGTKPFTFTVTLSGPAVGGESVDYRTAPGSATRSDFIPTSGTITFTAGQTTAPIVVLVRGDRQVEPNEKFHVVLSNPIGLTITDRKGLGKILNDDAAPPPPCTGVCSG